MAKIDLVNSLQDTIDTVQDALDKGADKAAFFCALSIPDICAQIEFSDSMGVRERYSKWYNENVYPSENPPGQFPMNQLDGDVAYLIRCKLYHEGDRSHRNTLKKLKKKYKNSLSLHEEFKGDKIEFSLEFVPEDTENFSICQTSNVANQENEVIYIKARVSPKTLSKKLIWIANGVIENFKKNNPPSH